MNSLSKLLASNVRKNTVKLSKAYPSRLAQIITALHPRKPYSHSENCNSNKNILFFTPPSPPPPSASNATNTSQQVLCDMFNSQSQWVTATFCHTNKQINIFQRIFVKENKKTKNENKRNVFEPWIEMDIKSQNK